MEVQAWVGIMPVNASILISKRCPDLVVWVCVLLQEGHCLGHVPQHRPQRRARQRAVRLYPICWQGRQNQPSIASIKNQNVMKVLSELGSQYFSWWVSIPSWRSFHLAGPSLMTFCRTEQTPGGRYMCTQLCQAPDWLPGRLYL